MWLRTLMLEQFRNHSSTELLFLPEHETHLFQGENGSGKTNLLEAIALLALTKSCRNGDDEDMILWDTTHFRVEGTVEYADGTKKTLECVGQRSPRRKAFFINGVRVSATQFIGAFPVNVFLPQDLSLFSGPPNIRRQFFDRLLCQVLPEYFREFLQYNKVLKQRNALLRQIAQGVLQETELDFWDEELAKAGSVLTLARLELLETLNVTLREELVGFGVEWENVSLSWKRSTTERSADLLVKEFVECLRRARPRDRILLHTSVGPHRDDWSFEVEGRNIATFASRGQQRLCLLALLFLQLSYVELRCGEKPVVLLDDVFSELDSGHQTCVLNMLDGYQVFLSAVQSFDVFSGCVWNVSEGRVQTEALEKSEACVAP